MRGQVVGLVLCVGVGAMACGHSEDEWQAQLKKYEQLSKRNQENEAEIEKLKGQIKDLEKKLADMGATLSSAGTEKENLLKALEEYKARADELARIKARFELLRKKLDQLTAIGLDVSIRKNRMVISLPGDVLFKSGEANLSDEGKEILKKVADVIRSDKTLFDRSYQVAGHTDNQKLTRAAGEFKDNWGLSLMRAREVLVFLTTPVRDKAGGGGMQAPRWSASGYGETDPVASNAAPDGRKKNRRVELILVPDISEMLDLKSAL